MFEKRNKRSALICGALATVLSAALGLASNDVVKADEATRSANYVELNSRSDAEGQSVSTDNKIVLVAGKTPAAVSRTEAAVGSAKKSRAVSSKNSDLAEELDNLPDLNVRPDDEVSGHKPHGAKLSGVMPGVTKFSELKKIPSFASPVAEETVDGFTVATYQDPTLPDTTIQIVGRDDLVEAIMINLNEPRSESDARSVFESELKDVRPIWAPDEAGNFREVFPEKGVAFVLEGGETPGQPSDRVVQIVAETVKCEYFIMRAEQDLLTSYTYARDDAEHALLHDAEAPGAHWILGQTHLAVGDYSNARKHLVKAIKLNDSMPQFHLTYIDALIQSGEVEMALRYMDAVRDTFKEHPLFQAEGLVLDSVLRCEAADPDYDGAIAQGQRALQLLQDLYGVKPTPDVALSAKKLELRANLSIAIAVARKTWKNPTDQEKTFEWLDAAAEVADVIDSTRTDDSQIPTAMIDVYQAALEVGLETPDAPKIDEYAQKIRVAAEIYLRKTKDEVSAASVRWRVGNSLVLASRIYEARKDYKQAGVTGLKALEYLQTVTEYRPVAERTPTILAQLQLGDVLINGLKKDDDAFANFAAAIETLDSIKDELKARDSARVGKPLASVATLYWKKGKKEEGAATMQKAVDFLEKAKDSGYVKDSDLYVPYSNLSTMYKGLKKTAEAVKYKKLAESCAPAEK